MAASDARLSDLRRALLRGLVIPAHPLALTEARALDERRQVALTRYYCDAGAGGIAVGVHTTQFAIRDPDIGLFEPVLQLAQQAAREWCEGRSQRPVMIAGVIGPTGQAMREAETAVALGYDAALLSVAALRDAGNRDLLEHCAPRGGRHPDHRLLPSAGGRRTPPGPGILARLLRDRSGGRRQGGAVRPLRDARCHDRPGRERPARMWRSTPEMTTPSWPTC